MGVILRRRIFYCVPLTGVLENKTLYAMFRRFVGSILLCRFLNVCESAMLYIPALFSRSYSGVAIFFTSPL